MGCLHGQRVDAAKAPEPTAGSGSRIPRFRCPSLQPDVEIESAVLDVRLVGGHGDLEPTVVSK